MITVEWSMKKMSIHLKIWLLAFLLIAGVVSYGFYTTFSVNRQIRQNFYRQSEQAVQSISDEIAAPLWLYQQPYVDKTFQAFQNTSSIVFLRLLNKDGALSYGYGDAAYAAIISEFAAGQAAHIKKDSIYLVRHPVIYKNEIQGTLFVGFTMREMEQQIASQQKEMLIFCGLFVLLGIIATLLIARSIYSPLKKMQKVLQQENTLGDLKGIHLPEQGGREVAGLAREVNRLGEKISEKMRTLENSQRISKGYFDENPVATLIVDLLLNDISVEELCAKVCSVRTSAGQPNRYGLRFCFEDARHMRSPRTAHALKQIEACLRTHSGYS